VILTTSSGGGAWIVGAYILAVWTVASVATGVWQPIPAAVRIIRRISGTEVTR
jgi:hypothetical protein